jgi:5'-3' exonuclease
MIYRDLFETYKAQTEELYQYMTSVDNTKLLDPKKIVELFHQAFDESTMNQLVIKGTVVLFILTLTRFVDSNSLRTIYVAIDGVPSKGKMIEQRQRRYMGAIQSEYKKRILKKYQSYLEAQPNHLYLKEINGVHWSTGAITPSTIFMHQLSSVLKSNSLLEKLKGKFPNLESYLVSDMYECGEGEMKIVNYINYKVNPELYNQDTFCVYSPDADVILLCMLLPTTKTFLLKYNQQDIQYDIIDVLKLKQNISLYINDHPLYSKENFAIDRIIYDIVCLASLFGNDFVPRMESFNVKQGFQNLLDAYTSSLLRLKPQNMHLVKVDPNETLGKGIVYRLNLTFLRDICSSLAEYENNFIKHNPLYHKYITYPRMVYIFDNKELNKDTVVEVYQEFKEQWDYFKNDMIQKRDLKKYIADDEFMRYLKKALNFTFEENQVSLEHLSNNDFVEFIKKYVKTQETNNPSQNQGTNFPKLAINLNSQSKDIADPYHARIVKDMNQYEKEIYKFDRMLNEYTKKLNAQPLQLTEDKIPEYYEKYFENHINEAQTGGKSKKGIKVSATASASASTNKHTIGGSNGTLDEIKNRGSLYYLEGLMWVFNYYFNDCGYLNTWYYPFERAPLMRDFAHYLNGISHDDFRNMFQGLDKYIIRDPLETFNPMEQFIYVSPLTPGNLKLLPEEFAQVLDRSVIPLDIYSHFVDIIDVVNDIEKEDCVASLDCRSLPYFSKCLYKDIKKPTMKDDKKILSYLRGVKLSENSKKRTESKFPDY